MTAPPSPAPLRRRPGPYVYLHGFASSPGANKARMFAQRLAPLGVTLHAPDLNVPTFETTTLTAQAEFDGYELQDDSTVPLGITLTVEPGVIVHVRREQKRTGQVEHDGVQQNEKVVREIPDLQLPEIELPPPPESHVEKHVGRPDKVNPVDPVTSGMLDESGHAAQQVGDPEADDDRRQDRDVFKDSHGCRPASSVARPTV